MNLILASTSPRRYELLSLLDMPFNTTSVDIDESVLGEEMPTNYIERMVRQKTQAFINQCQKQVILTDMSLVLTADTIGVMPNGKDVLVKPINKADAFNMWKKMSDNQHEVWTAVQATLLNAQAEILWQRQITEVTSVQFTAIDEAEMESYWQTGEPADKAGGYAIQGKGAIWVKAIIGSYTNVVGLPLAQTKQLIEQSLNIINSMGYSSTLGSSLSD